MAEPSYVNAQPGATDAGGDWSYTCQAATAAGNVFIVHVLQDGTTYPAVAVTGSSNINDLSGSAGWTEVLHLAVGAPTAAIQWMFIGRATSTSAPTISGTNSTSEDLYIAASQFTDVSVGQDIYNVIENVTAGTTYSNVGTSDTATAPSVTTLGADRRGILLLSVNDDNATSVFTSPGNWSIGHSYAEASGTDGKVELQHRSIPTATTVNPGTCTVTDIDAWGVVGFALRPVPTDTRTFNPPYQKPDETFTDTSGGSNAHLLVDDDPTNQDGVLWKDLAAGAGGAELTVGFPTPSYTLDATTDIQKFRVRMRAPDGSTTITVALEEGTTVLTERDSQNFTVGTTWAVYEMAWSEGSLAGNGENVWCSVRSAAFVNLIIDAVDWYAPQATATKSLPPRRRSCHLIRR